MSNSHTQLDKPIKIEVAVDHVFFFFFWLNCRTKGRNASAMISTSLFTAHQRVFKGK